MRRTINLKTYLLISVILVTLRTTSASAEVIYVDASASAGGNGQNWATAYKYLQEALYKPPSGGDEIWVGEGTYKPNVGNLQVRFREGH
ncbi:MAG: hypothetical protein OEW48_14905 [Phycisphaerae bacterium]|nr:hypothetical protein [Phycisphaerae bacterium]